MNRFGAFEIEGTKFPKISLGTSPFIGAGQFGEKAYEYYKRFYENPKNITDIIIKCAERGCTSIQLISYPPLVSAVEEATNIINKELFLCACVGIGDIYGELKLIEKLEPKCIVIHASYADRNPFGAQEKLNEIKDHFNVITGISTHLPGITIKKVMEMKEVEVILAPINKIGKFMKPSFETTISGIEKARGSGKKVIAIKPLAAGELSPEEGFRFLKDEVDGVAVGMTNDKEIEETLNAGEKYFI